jgi:uncharacterized protein (TIGR01777 family)
VLSRDAAGARSRFADTDQAEGENADSGQAPTKPIEVMQWDPISEPAPVAALAGRDAIIHLAGATIAQRWNQKSRAEITDSRVLGTRHLVDGIRAAIGSQPDAAPKMLLSSSAIGYYGNRGAEPLDEEADGGSGFLADICAAWEREAAVATELGVRVAQLRTGVVLDAHAGALAKMLPPFRLGIGGPVAGGQQYVSWIHLDDLIALALSCCEDERWSGPVNATAPHPATNAELSRALGRALHRPSMLPVPGLVVRMLYGEMAELVTAGARVVPAKALVLGYAFKHPDLDEALADTLS